MTVAAAGTIRRSRGRLDSRVGSYVLFLAMLAGHGSVFGQNWRFVPSITISETLTDNVDLAPDDRKKYDLITDVVAAVSLNGRSGRASLSLNYQMHNLLYAHESARNTIQNFLDARGTLEAVEKWLFIEGSASITQQAISAFQPQPVSVGTINNNRSETAAYQLSPYITGRIGSFADYQLRYRWTTTRADAISDAYVSEWTASLRGEPTRLGWSIEANNQALHNNAAPDTESTRLRATVSYLVDPQLRIFVTGGRETNNYSAANREANNYGAGFDWTPTPRTQISAVKERRFFGDGHSITLAHRLPLVALRFTDRRDVTNLPLQLAAAGRGTAFDLLFSALASRIPDPVARTQEVERLLAQSGIPADLLVARNFLTTSAFVNRAREASVAILGVRNTITFTAAISDQRSVTATIGGFDDFSRTGEVELRTITADWSHRVSPLTTFNLLASENQATGSTGGQESRQRIVRLGVSHQLGARTSASLGARVVWFDSALAPGYSEKALTASLSSTF